MLKVHVMTFHHVYMSASMWFSLSCLWMIYAAELTTFKSVLLVWIQSRSADTLTSCLRPSALLFNHVFIDSFYVLYVWISINWPILSLLSNILMYLKDLYVTFSMYPHTMVSYQAKTYAHVFIHIIRVFNWWISSHIDGLVPFFLLWNEI